MPSAVAPARVRRLHCLAPQPQIHGDAFSERREPQLFEAGGRRPQAGRVEGVQGRTAPQRQPRPQRVGRLKVITSRLRSAARRQQGFEPASVELAGIDLKHVARRPGHDDITRTGVLQGTTKPGNVALHQRRRGGRRIGPDRVNEVLDRHDPPGAEKPGREQGP
jgi:hypothetical protein